MDGIKETPSLINRQVYVNGCHTSMRPEAEIQDALKVKNNYDTGNDPEKHKDRFRKVELLIVSLKYMSRNLALEVLIL